MNTSVRNTSAILLLRLNTGKALESLTLTDKDQPLNWGCFF
jgi:hypothetical protein